MDAGGKLYPCNMTYDLYNLIPDIIIDNVEKILTANEFTDLTPTA
jgi:peroxiredoxin family protein